MKTRYLALPLLLATGLLWAANEESPTATAVNAARAASKPVATIKVPAAHKPALQLVRKPTPYRTTSRLKKPSRTGGKVRTLPATALPANAIIPPLKNGSTETKSAAATNIQPPAYILHDSNLRWQFYSYP
jgi:hypothetical protein